MKPVEHIFAVLTYESHPWIPHAKASNYYIWHGIARQSMNTAHSPIHINGNTDFASQALQEGWQWLGHTKRLSH